MFYVNSELFPRKCEQFDQSVDNIVHTWRAMINSIHKQYTWTVYVNSVPIGMKVWTILFRYGQHCPHFLRTLCTVSYYPETCLTQTTFCKLGLQCNSYITFIKLLHLWNLPWPEYIIYQQQIQREILIYQQQIHIEIPKNNILILIHIIIINHKSNLKNK